MVEPDVVPDEGLQIVESGADGQLTIIGWGHFQSIQPDP